MGLVKLRCEKCGTILDEDEIASITVNHISKTISIEISCWKCGACKEAMVDLPDFLEIM